MAKKKSYMNREILNEGIVSWTMDKIYKFFLLNPALKKSKKVNNSIKQIIKIFFI